MYERIFSTFDRFYELYFLLRAKITRVQYYELAMSYVRAIGRVIVFVCIWEDIVLDLMNILVTDAKVMYFFVVFSTDIQAI